MQLVRLRVEVFSYIPFLVSIAVRLSVRLKTSNQSIDPARLEKEAAKLENLAWVAFRQGDVFCGVYPDALGVILYQMEGNRLIATVNMMQACQRISADLDLVNTPQQDLKKLQEDPERPPCPP